MCRAMLPPDQLSREFKALWISRSEQYTKQAENPKKPGRKLKVVPEKLLVLVCDTI